MNFNLKKGSKEESKTHIEIDYSQNKVFLRDEENNILAENEFPGLLSNRMEQYESLKSLYPDGNVPKDVKITYIMSTEERRLQDKLNEMHITNIVARDVIYSSGPDDFLRSWGVSEENTDIIMNFLNRRW